MLSIVSGQEADEAERDREEFEAWYDTVRANQALQVCVWRQEALSSRYIPELEKRLFSQRPIRVSSFAFSHRSGCILSSWTAGGAHICVT